MDDICVRERTQISSIVKKLFSREDLQAGYPDWLNPAIGNMIRCFIDRLNQYCLKIKILKKVLTQIKNFYTLIMDEKLSGIKLHMDAVH